MAINREDATETRMIEVKVKFMTSLGKIPSPIVTDTFLPAMRAPRKTKMPNNPGIKSLRMMLAPYAAENDGAVPLPPILMAKNMARRNGINRIENAGDSNWRSFLLDNYDEA